MTILLLKFQTGDRGDLIARSPTGKVCLLDRSSKYTLLAGERWVCDVVSDADRFMRVRPLIREDQVAWGWKPTDEVVLGVARQVWQPLEPSFQDIGLAPPTTPDREAKNAPFHAAQETSRIISSGSIPRLVEMFGQPTQVNTDAEGAWVTISWAMTPYGPVTTSRPINGFNSPWPLVYTGAVRASVSYHGGVEAQVTLAEWPEMIGWKGIGTVQHMYAIDIPPAVAEAARKVLAESATDLEAHTKQFAATLAAYNPTSRIWKRALVLADPESKHVRVEARQKSEIVREHYRFGNLEDGYYDGGVGPPKWVTTSYNVTLVGWLASRQAVLTQSDLGIHEEDNEDNGTPTVWLPDEAACHPPGVMDAYHTRLTAMLAAREAEIEAEAQALVPTIAEVFAADTAWMAARETLQEALRYSMSYTPVPHVATDATAQGLLREASAMQTLAAQLLTPTPIATTTTTTPIATTTTTATAPEASLAALQARFSGLSRRR